MHYAQQLTAVSERHVGGFKLGTRPAGAEIFDRATPCLNSPVGWQVSCGACGWSISWALARRSLNAFQKISAARPMFLVLLCSLRPLLGPHRPPVSCCRVYRPSPLQQAPTPSTAPGKVKAMCPSAHCANAKARVRRTPRATRLTSGACNFAAMGGRPQGGEWGRSVMDRGCACTWHGWPRAELSGTPLCSSRSVLGLKISPRIKIQSPPRNSPNQTTHGTPTTQPPLAPPVAAPILGATLSGNTIDPGRRGRAGVKFSPPPPRHRVAWVGFHWAACP